MKNKTLMIIMVVFIVALLAVLVYALDTGAICPSGYSTRTGGFLGPDAIFDDCVETGVYASETTNNDAEYYYNFGFSIPAGATINGVEARIYGYNENTLPLNGDTVQVGVAISQNNGSSFSGEKNNTWAWDGSATNSMNVYGGPTDTWGLSLTDTSFSNANFKTYLKVSLLNGATETMYMDLFTVTVYYTTSSPCTYSGSGNWNPPCNCTLNNVNYNLKGANLTINGTGLFYINSTANLTNWTNGNIRGINTTLLCTVTSYGRFGR